MRTQEATDQDVTVSILLITLTCLFILAVFLTTFVIGTYLFTRLALQVRAHGLPGIYEWYSETSQHFLKRKSPIPEHYHESSEGEGSVIIVKSSEDYSASQLNEEPRPPTQEINPGEL